MKYLTFLIVLFFVACSDSDPELPVCMDPIFEEYKTVACKNSGDLTTWEFNGELVYCFLIGTCVADGGADIYDANCNFLCTLGGLSGNMVCQGLDWETNAVFIETLYVH